MALALFDRVQETSTTAGTGSIVLAGAVSGFQSFAVVGNGNTCYYTIVDGSAWEVGVGTYSTSGPTLARTTILSNSNGNTSPLTLTANSKSVFLTYPAGKSVNLNESGNVSPLGTVVSGIWNGTTIGVAYGGTGVTASSGANSVVLRDSNQNVAVNRVNQANTNTTAAGGTTALTAASSYIHTLVGTGGQTYTLPDATTLTTGVAFVFNNLATSTLTVANYAGTTIGTIPSGGAGAVFLTLNSTVGGTWDLHAYLPEGVTFGTNAFNLGTSVISGGTWQGGTIQTGYGGTGLTSYTSGGAVYANSSSTLTSGTLPITAGGTGNTSGQAASTASSATFNSGGAGDASGTTFNGSAARTISYNTIGAPSTTGTNASGSWGISVTGTSSNITAYTINQNLGTGNQVTFDSVVTGNNGNGTNFRLGDDAWIGDVNIANTTRLQGVQSAASGYLIFGNGDTTALGRAGTGALTYGGNAVLTAGNYNSYAPTLTGGGASGTWSINITGSAGSAPGYLPLSGGTMTGTLSFQQPVGLGFANGQYIKDNGGGGLVIYSGAQINLNSGSSVTISGANSPSVPVVPITVTGSGSFQRGVRMLNSGMAGGDSLMYAVGQADNSKNMGQFYFYYAGSGSNSNRISMGLHSVDDVLNIFGTGNTSFGTTTDSGYKLNISGTGYATSDFRAPIFYDSNNTAYYVDPASTSTLQSISSVGVDVAYSARWDVGASNWSGRIVSRNYTYNVSAFLGSYNGYAGLFGHSAALDAWSPVYINAFGGTAQANVYLGNMYSPIFYDLNNTAYYCDPASTSNLVQVNAGTFFDGYITWSAAQMNRPGSNIELQYGATANSTVYIGAGGSNPIRFYANTGVGTFAGNVQAPIFYDFNNTAFYVDPAGTSVLNVLSDPALSDSKLYLRTRGDTNHYLWNAGDDWEELVAYSGTGFRVANSTGVGAILTCFGSDNGNYVQARGSMRAPIFYDSDNTGYYVNAAETSLLNILDIGTGSGGNQRILFKAGNDSSSYSALRFSFAGSETMQMHIFGPNWQGGGFPNNSAGAFNISGTNGTTFGSWPSPTAWISAGGIIQGNDSVRGPIFYDSNDTTFYLDPNSTGVALSSNGIVSSGTGTAGGFQNRTYTSGRNRIWSFGNADGYGMGYFQGGGGYGGSDSIGIHFGSAVADCNFIFRSNSDFIAKGNITAYSDERLKTDWADLQTGFVEALAKIKSGTYTRTDTGARQAGVGAQSLQPLLPEVVMDEGPHLAVAYGNAAMVSAVELAKYVTALEQRISQLEARL